MNRYSDITNLISKRLEELSEYRECTYEKLLEAQKYSITAGGKHLRGLILIKTAMLGTTEYDVALDFACALEMIHTYSLIHDDLPEMDNDETRRGKPTCHIKYGTDIALLAGDALLTKAFSVITNSDATDSIKVKCINILSQAAGEHGMLAGQTIDKCFENIPASIEVLEELQARKTGDMFKAAIEIGCVLGDIDIAKKSALINYIENLGLAFQIKDDILDVTSTEQVLGKPINSDSKQNKSTFVSLLGINGANEMLKQKVDNAKKSLGNIHDPFYIVLADYFADRIK